VVDEASMVDLCRFDALLKAVAPECRILLVGDMHQLPSVEAGAVLGDLICAFGETTSFSTLGKETAQWIDQVAARVETDGGSAAEKATIILPDGKTDTGALIDRVVILNRSYRSTNAILLLGEAVNNGDRAAARSIIAENGVSGAVGLLTERGTQPVAAWLGEQYSDARLDPVKRLRTLDLEVINDPASPANALIAGAVKEAFAILDKSRILTLANEGPRGRRGINALAERMLRPLLDPDTRSRFFHGMQIVLGANHHALDLYNGDTGMVVRPAGGGPKAVFRRGNSFFIHDLDRLIDIEPAFAMTVHKSQGSEFDEVLLCLPEYKSPLLTRQIIYTGITRAKSKIRILGSEELLIGAIGNCEKRPGGIVVG